MEWVQISEGVKAMKGLLNRREIDQGIESRAIRAVRVGGVLLVPMEDVALYAQQLRGLVTKAGLMAATGMSRRQVDRCIREGWAVPHLVGRRQMFIPFDVMTRMVAAMDGKTVEKEEK